MIPVRPTVRFFWRLILTLGLGAAPAAAAEPAPLLAHRADIVFDLAAHHVQIDDEVLVPAGLTELRLGAGFDITRITVLDNVMVDVNTAVEAAEDGNGPYQRLVVSRLGLRNGGFLLVSYGGNFDQPVADVVFSRENVGGEITATIGSEGVYLSSAAQWLVGLEGALATYDLAITTPAGYETVTQGERTFHQVEGDRLQTRWVADRPSDGINLIANRYVVHSEPVRDGVTAMTFFLADEPRLRETYLERTRAYIAMYEEMIGPYPYAKFATVENWFPTGYGMPSYTLLGSQVLRLPFIPYTSFGHEIAHNWWGNSVFVDIGEGNWCEGLTSYCADYHYKELESAEAAREYRRNMLKDYAAYVRDPAKDFPLAEFRNRHSGATRAVGYGKSMMVFHMVDRMIGRANFLNALRTVAADHQFTAAAWSDFLAVFGAAGDRDLAGFGTQWLTRSGAPDLSLGRVDFGAAEVKLEIRQTAPAYDLEIPVVVTTAAGDREHVVHLDRESAAFTIAEAGITAVAVDPDYHLFRRLHPQEIEATISQVLGDDAPVFVTAATAPILLAAAQAFAADWTEDEAAVLRTDGRPVTAGHANILINPAPELLARLAPAELKVAGSLIFLAGKRYERSRFDLVYAVPDPDDPTLTALVVLCEAPERLEGLAGRISHYGKYSWLLLPSGSGSPERGNWTAGESPLSAIRTAKR